LKTPTTSPTPSWTLARFFVPLAIQAASQALSYPLVAIVAARGAGGPLNLAGLAQANTVMFFLGMCTIIVTGLALLFLGTPGQLIGPAGLTLGSLASSATMRIALVRTAEGSIPVGQTTTSVGQIR
jgi:hypothetical protein